jgi:hypothetical protein
VSVPCAYKNMVSLLPLALPPLRGCPQAQFFHIKNIKTYLSRPKKGTFRGLPGVALSRG